MHTLKTGVFRLDGQRVILTVNLLFTMSLVLAVSTANAATLALWSFDDGAVGASLSNTTEYRL